MKLSRHGARRNSGNAILFDKKPVIYVGSENIQLEVYSVEDKDGQSKFVYRVEISKIELMEILQDIVLKS